MADMCTLPKNVMPYSKAMVEAESNAELAFLDTSLKPNNGKISVLAYRKSSPTNTYTTAITTKQVVGKALFLPCSIEHIPLSLIKMH